MSNRKEGWYWLKTANGTSGDIWLPSKWSPDYKFGPTWFSCGYHVNEDDIVEIGPRIPYPDEPWQTVPKQANERMIVELMCTGLRHAEYVTGHAPTVSEMQQGYQFMLSAAPKPEDA